MSLWKGFKNLLKRILPPPTRTFLREIRYLHQENQKALQTVEGWLIGLDEKYENDEQKRSALFHRMTDQMEAITQRLDKQNSALEGIIAAVDGRLTERLSELEKRIEAIRDKQKEIGQSQNEQQRILLEMSGEQQKAIHLISRARDNSGAGQRLAAEAVWAEVFNNTIQGSQWLQNASFSPGRWAIGYQYLYVMYRALNEVHPKRILDLGLGQSSRMIAQYVAANEDVEHIIVEHDPEWIQFFENDFSLPPNTRIVQLEREMVPFREAEAVRIFKDFSSTFTDQVFDLISIDAPMGGDMKEYSRIDILSILPKCLSEEFIIMMDDCERNGEQNTLQEIERVLKDNEIDYAKGRYSGAKDMVLLCAPQNAFLTTM